ncbi:MAG: aminopeptidase P family protein [Syntrophobacterales bacterium]|nr:aminopeptidase P family protein [Syntrophobacterales bacterium]
MSKMFTWENQIFPKRMISLQKQMSNTGVDVILLSYSKSIYYFAGTTQPSILLITPENYHLVVTRGLEFVRRETWFDPENLGLGRGYEDVSEMLKTWGKGSGVLGLELDIIPTILYFEVSKLFAGFEITDISNLILEQRKVKDAGEVENIREACRIVHQGHLRILDVLREGMTELELSSEIEDAHRRAGDEGQYFIRQFDFFMGRGIVASGANLSKIAGKVQSITGVGLSSSIPLGASLKKIQRGEMIVVDFATYYHGYHSDQSRTYVVGKSPEGCKSIYEGMKEIADRIILFLKPGLRCDHVYNLAMEFAAELKVKDYFMRLGGSPQKVSFIGHGVGLELNEPPLLHKNNREVLKEGNVITLELEMWKSAGEVVKLEDTILITSRGAEILTITPRNLHEV